MKKALILTMLTAAVAFAQSPKADVDSILNYIKESNPSKNWKTINDRGEMFKNSRRAHGAYLSIYVNDLAYEGIKKGESVLPYGSMIVNENYEKDKSPKYTLIKYKVKGFDAKNNDWFFAMVMPDGKIQASGQVEKCITCHVNARKADFIHTGHKFKYEVPKK